MRLLNDKRGQIRVIEAFFAAMLLLSIFALIPKPSNSQDNTIPTLTSTAQNALLSLDQNGQIGNLIVSQNWAELKTLIQTGLPPAAWFNLTVYDLNLQVLNDVPICSGSQVSDSIVAVDYPCASTGGDFSVYLVRLQVAVAD
ncbi:MAG: hypothetical protein ACQCN5_11885 [Candidatus Bathyarchaeia archaeon]|jgi:hypothetical protein